MKKDLLDAGVEVYIPENPAWIVWTYISRN